METNYTKLFLKISPQKPKMGPTIAGFYDFLAFDFEVNKTLVKNVQLENLNHGNLELR